ncbi:MAG TPA: TolC family protein, partial [Gillisia sp.]|nr:TolC family protein [Gillisia sp.]
MKNTYIYMFMLLFLGIGSQQLQAQDALENYLEIAVKNNPKLKSSYAQFEAAMRNSPQVSSLPDPTLTMSGLGRMIETRAGTQEARFNLMQMFPWFGTLEAKKNAANLMAEAKFQKYLDLKNQVIYEVKSAYAELYSLSATIQIKEEDLDILESYRELALSRFKSGDGAMVNVVKVDIDKDAATTEIEIMKEMLVPVSTNFNLLLNRDPQETIIVQDTLKLPELPLEITSENNLEANPLLKAIENEQASYLAEQTVAEKQGLPNIGVGLDYSIISTRTDANPEGNGQDAIMPMVSISLPIFRKKYKASREQAEFLYSSSESEHEAVMNELKSMLAITVYEYQKSEKLVRLYNRQLISSGQANK